MLFKRKPKAKKPAPSPLLNEMRERLETAVRDADERVERVLNRLRELEGETKP